jgi:hypothetical protein
MNRDRVLSILSQRKPGHIDWNGSFVAQIGLLVVLPLLGLIGIHFPTAFSGPLQWITSAMPHH